MSKRLVYFDGISYKLNTKYGYNNHVKHYWNIFDISTPIKIVNVVFSTKVVFPSGKSFFLYFYENRKFYIVVNTESYQSEFFYTINQIKRKHFECFNDCNTEEINLITELSKSLIENFDKIQLNFLNIRRYENERRRYENERKKTKNYEEFKDEEYL